MASSELKNCWVVGEVKWSDSGIANMRIGRTKTDARQKAERMMAYAKVEAGRPGCVQRKKLEARTRDGIWLTGPNGERVHIVKPGVKALRDCEKRFAVSDHYRDAANAAMRDSLQRLSDRPRHGMSLAGA